MNESRRVVRRFLPIAACAALCLACARPGAAARSASRTKPRAAVKKAPPTASGPRMFGGMAEVFGFVKDVRGKVIQMATPGGKGLTRVILTKNAMVQKQEKATAAELKPGALVMGEGIAPEGAEGEPKSLVAQSLRLAGNGGGGPGFFGGNEAGPLWRGRQTHTFQHENYSGTWTFNGRVSSVNPVTLVDDAGKPLPVTVAGHLEIQRSVVRPVQVGDVHAGSMIVALGKPTPDGLVNAQMIVLLQDANGPQAMSGPILGVTANGVKLHPRFMDQEQTIAIPSAAKVFRQETVSPDSVGVGDEVELSGTVIGGDASAPTSMVIRVLTPGDGAIPAIHLPSGGGMFGGGGGGTMARVKGKIDSLDPLQLTTDDGRQISLILPGQCAFAKFTRISKSELKTGRRALFVVHMNAAGAPVADDVILDASALLDEGL